MGSQRGKNKKIKWGGVPGKALQLQGEGWAVTGGGATVRANHLSACRALSEAAGPFCPGSVLQAVLRLLWKLGNTFTAPCREGEGSCYCAKSGNRPKLTAIYCQAFPWKVQDFNRLQSSKIVIPLFCKCNCLDR